MEKMKDSGVKWIGNIPKNWKIKKIKYITKIPITDGPHETPVFVDEGVPFYSVDGIQNEHIIYEPCRYISIEDANRFDKKEIPLYGDILMGKAASIGKIAIIDRNIRMQIWSPLAIIRANENIVNNIFLKYYLLSNSAQTEIELKSTSNTQKNIAMEDIENIIIPLPSIDEQKLIACFVDKKVMNIDEILKKLNNQIEILENYKKSLITEIVTKGLNTNIEMKNSEIDWIGDIPKHWDIYYLKHLFKMYAGGDADEYDFSAEYSEVTPYPIYSNSLENDGLFGYMSKYRFSGNTFTVTGRGDVGKAIARNNKYYPIVRLLVCIPLFEDDTRYYSYCVNSADLLGEQTAMAQLTTQKLGINKFPRPPIYEQKEIADYLDKKCKEIDELVEDKKQQIEKMVQYKKSLIYEYVTGKKRVKGAEELYG